MRDRLRSILLGTLIIETFFVALGLLVVYYLAVMVIFWSIVLVYLAYRIGDEWYHPEKYGDNPFY